MNARFLVSNHRSRRREAFNFPEIIEAFHRDRHLSFAIVEQIEIGPKRRTDEHDIADLDDTWVEQIDAKQISDRFHPFARRIEIVVIEFMIAGHINNPSMKRAAGPLQAAAVEIDIAGENDDVDLRLMRNQARRAQELVVQVGEDEDSHHDHRFANSRSASLYFSMTPHPIPITFTRFFQRSITLRQSRRSLPAGQARAASAAATEAAASLSA
jgi:hypothetical protein